MPTQQTRTRPLLSGNALKILAAAAMLLDHAGLMLFPANALFRIIGRLAFPIYAYMIAEGCKYTRSRLRYFLQLFLLAVVCQTVYHFAGGSPYLSILCTFSLSIVTIYVLQYFKAEKTVLSGILLALTVVIVHALNQLVAIDYGFWGCMAPVFASLPQGTKHDSTAASTALLGLGLVFLSISLGGIQFWCLAALPLLYCYSGQRGKRNMKYFFYIFYPAHLVVLQIIAWIRA